MLSHVQQVQAELAEVDRVAALAQVPGAGAQVLEALQRQARLLLQAGVVRVGVVEDVPQHEPEHEEAGGLADVGHGDDIVLAQLEHAPHAGVEDALLLRVLEDAQVVVLVVDGRHAREGDVGPPPSSDDELGGPAPPPCLDPLGGGQPLGFSAGLAAPAYHFFDTVAKRGGG